MYDEPSNVVYTTSGCTCLVCGDGTMHTQSGGVLSGTTECSKCHAIVPAEITIEEADELMRLNS